VKTLPLLALILAVPLLAQTNPRSTPADRDAGSRIFRTHCANCHGLKGTGGTGPDLTSGRFFHGSTDADLYRNIGEGIPNTAMPDTFFNGTQVWQIVAFVRSLSQQAAHAPLMGNPAHGAQLAKEKGCTGCHLIRGEGTVQGPDLSVIGSQRSPDFLRESILDPSAHVAPEYRVAKIIGNDRTSYSGFLLNQDTYTIQIMDFSRGLISIRRSAIKDFGIDSGSFMPSYKDRLTSAETDDIVSYLASLRREKGTTE
jgi:putative heme-binding domain-containing protein